jgi:lysophospholipase L1-like esterase
MLCLFLLYVESLLTLSKRCWRNNLQAKLKSAGITNYDMVGSQKGSADCTTQFPGTDNDHEGHPGSLATDYATKGNLTTWLNQQPQVDVVLMFLGHNDIILGHKPFDEIFAAYDTLIDQMRKKNPKMQIVWSNLTPVDAAKWDTTSSPRNSKDIADLSAKIKTYAPTKSTSDSPVRFVDNFAGYDAVHDTDDGEHPNAKGNEKMASKFLGATRDAIRAVSRRRARGTLGTRKVTMEDRRRQ